jgi:hypothetical protein
MMRYRHCGAEVENDRNGKVGRRNAMKDLIRSFEIERKTCGTLDKQGSDNMA